MDRKHRVVAISVMVISVLTLILVTLGGGMLQAFHELLGLLGLSSGKGVFDSPLGTAVVVIYACGAVLGLAALRWPTQAGIAMVVLGVCAFLFGGPVSKVYGILLCAAGGILVTICLRQRRPASPL